MPAGQVLASKAAGSLELPHRGTASLTASTANPSALRLEQQVYEGYRQRQPLILSLFRAQDRGQARVEVCGGTSAGRLIPPA